MANTVWGVLEEGPGNFTLTPFRADITLGAACRFMTQGRVFTPESVVCISSDAAILVCAEEAGERPFHSLAPFPLSLRVLRGSACAFLHATGFSADRGPPCVASSVRIDALKHITLDSWLVLSKGCAALSVDAVVCDVFGGGLVDDADDDDDATTAAEDDSNGMADDDGDSHAEDSQGEEGDDGDEEDDSGDDEDDSGDDEDAEGTTQPASAAVQDDEDEDDEEEDGL